MPLVKNTTRLKVQYSDCIRPTGVEWTPLGYYDNMKAFYVQ